MESLQPGDRISRQQGIGEAIPEAEGLTDRGSFHTLSVITATQRLDWSAPSARVTRSWSTPSAWRTRSRTLPERAERPGDAKPEPGARRAPGLVPLEVSRLLWALELFLLALEALGFASAAAQPSPQLHQGLAAVALAQLPLLLASRQGRFQAPPPALGRPRETRSWSTPSAWITS